MKKSISILFVFAVVLGFSMQAHATLELLGQGSMEGSYNLIYDTDLDITWFDYTNYGATEFGDTWQSQLNWAANLAVIFGDSTYTEWRLPSSSDPGCWGYGCTNNEMGQLYWELGNSVEGPLTYTGDFDNLQTANGYWTGTTYDTWNSMMYYFAYEYQYAAGTSLKYYGLAVHDGELVATVVPEPISSILFVTGGTMLACRRFFFPNEDKEE